jgi:hypothetical protein
VPNPFLQAALKYRQMGYHPIPCRPKDKIPLLSWKDFQTTMPTDEQIQSWWSRTPDANVALVLGRGTFAVDLDGGDDAEQLLANAGIALPPGAPRSRTGSGYHVFLTSYNAVPDRVGLLSTNGGKPQVDIRGVGIVIAPPSVHPNGKVYEWIEPLMVVKPPHTPLNLVDLIARAPVKEDSGTATWAVQQSRFWVADALRGVGEGQRDQTCTRLAGYFLQKGIPEEAVTALLSESFGRACVPPFSSRDVEKCVASIARRESVEGSDRAVAAKHISAVLNEFEESLSRGPSPTLPTPFPTLNHFLNGGFAPGELIFLGARPGVGKTALGLELARKAAQRAAGATLIISREMKNIALARRLVAQDSRIPASTLKRAELDKSQQWSFVQSLSRLRQLPLWFTDDVVSLDEILTLIHDMSTETPLDLLVVDYLQLIRAPKSVKERRHQVEAVSQGLKTLALQYNMPVLCLSSLSRAPKDEKMRPPSLSDLRESGELEHDADVILLLHRQYHEQDTQCIVAKNRDGRLGTVQLNFRSEYVAFDEAAAQAENEVWQ